jgi:thiol:disulfide interchange protein DsbD
MDDRKPLPKEEHYISPIDGSKVKTVGARNSHFAISKFGTAPLPYYILLDPHDESMLVNPPLAFELSTVVYLDYLKKGLENFRKKH